METLQQASRFSSYFSSSYAALQSPHLCFSFPHRACSSALSTDDHDLRLDESTLISRKHQIGFTTEDEMQTFFKRRGKGACELSDAVSHLIRPRFNLIGGLEHFRGEADENYVVLDDETISDDDTAMDKKNECDKLLKASECVEEVFDQSFHELGRNAIRCLGEGQGRLVEGIPYFVQDMKEGRLLIPKHSKVALDSSLIVYLLQPAGNEDGVFAQKKKILLHVFSKPFFFVVSEFSLSTDIPSGMLDRQSPQPTSEERQKLCAVWRSFIDFFEQYATVVHSERGFASVRNLLHLLRCDYDRSWRGKVLLDSIGPEVHLMLIGDHRYHGRTLRGIREGTMRTILMWCPFLQDVAYYNQDGSVAIA